MENRDPSIVVIRPFRPHDNDDVQKLIIESTMSSVNQFFIKSLTREIYFQTVIMTAAIMFIFLGLPFYWTLIGVPVVMALLFYLIIRSAHYYKAHYLHYDLKDILTTYLSSDKTCFFVAEAYGPIPPKGHISRNHHQSSSIAFISFAEFQTLDRNGSISGSGRKREIIGTIGVCRDNNSAVIAWARRMSVAKSWRGHGVGSQLIDTVIKFCNNRAFVAIELVTTECHDTARKLYEKKGFETKQLYHKNFYLSSLAITMHFMTFKTRPTYKGTAVEL